MTMAYWQMMFCLSKIVRLFLQSSIFQLQSCSNCYYNCSYCDLSLSYFWSFVLISAIAYSYLCLYSSIQCLITYEADCCYIFTTSVYLVYCSFICNYKQSFDLYSSTYLMVFSSSLDTKSLHFIAIYRTSSSFTCNFKFIYLIFSPFLLTYYVSSLLCFYNNSTCLFMVYQ